MEEAKNLGGEGLLSYQGVGTIDAIVLNIMVKLVKGRLMLFILTNFLIFSIAWEVCYIMSNILRNKMLV